MNIFNFDSRTYRFLEKITDFLLLNMLWIIFCLPVFTIFPATAAMFGVVRSWLRKEEPSLTRLFFKFFKDHFKQGIILGMIWTLLGVLISFNLFVGLQMEGSLKNVLLPALMVIGALFLFTSIYLFPIMVNYNNNWIGIIKNSFLFSISHPITTILGIVMLTIVVLATSVIPLSFLVLSSIVAYFIYYLCSKSFRKVERQKNISFKKEVS
ncbi:YesL family protein [Rossellomorea sp. BNER]|uniref:YesL family protein n=1 Tax=Rossellomorea sp. BNER TaxID=2962031 RepID=UPI003AF1F411|nr:DUF624 domain-containing protein [Rossellomorea sp. BNER]